MLAEGEQLLGASHPGTAAITASASYPQHQDVVIIRSIVRDVPFGCRSETPLT